MTLSRLMLSRSLLMIAIIVMTSADVTAAAPSVSKIKVDGMRATELYDGFIVKYRNGSAEQRNLSAAQRALSGAAKRAGPVVSAQAPGVIGPLSLRRQRRLAIGADVVRVSRKLNRAESTALMQAIAADADVEYVEVDSFRKPLFTPNDPSYPSQWQYSDPVGGINAPSAWNLATGAGVVVAVVDSGITSHSDLNANVLPGYDFISDPTAARDGNGRDSNPADPGDWVFEGECESFSPAANSGWHGTHVAGTIAAVTNNGKGVAGVAYRAKLVPVRVLGACGGRASDIADAITWASGGTVAGVPKNNNPAEVINLSFGRDEACSAVERAAINGAIARGSIVVAAAGERQSTYGSNGSSPANCGNLIVVGGTDREGYSDGLSNDGASIDVSAPSGTYDKLNESVFSTSNSGTTTPGAETYAYAQGSSIAAAHVSGVAALVQSIATTPLTQKQLERLLKNTARLTCQYCGMGIVNAYEVVQKANTPQKPIYSAYQIYKTRNGFVTSIILNSGSDNFRTYMTEFGTALGITGGDNTWEFKIADYNNDGTQDLYSINKMGTSGKTEVHILDGLTDYRKFTLHKALPLAQTGRNSAWVYLVGDYNRDGKNDLYAIAKTATGSGSTEVHILNGADNFSTYLLHKALPLGLTGGNDAWVFSLGDYNADGIADLYGIAKMASSGTTEVHILNGANAFSTFLLHAKSALGSTGSDNAWVFQTADYNRDGRADLYAFKKTADPLPEVHILNANGNFGTFLLHAKTNLWAGGSDHTWEIVLAEY